MITPPSGCLLFLWGVNSTFGGFTPYFGSFNSFFEGLLLLMGGVNSSLWRKGSDREHVEDSAVCRYENWSRSFGVTRSLMISGGNRNTPVWELDCSEVREITWRYLLSSLFLTVTWQTRCSHFHFDLSLSSVGGRTRLTEQLPASRQEVTYCCSWKGVFSSFFPLCALRQLSSSSVARRRCVF